MSAPAPGQPTASSRPSTTAAAAGARAKAAAEHLPDAIGWMIEGVRFGYPDAPRPAIDDVTATIVPGRCTALIGPNGSGKSSLIRLLLGVLRPDAGAIRLGNRPLSRWSRRELARTVGVVPQREEIAFPLTVRELVSMGRYPHLGPLRPAGDRDRAVVDVAMRACDIEAFADRPMNTLSGGERQRARIARALAQEPAVLALDEPTIALDVAHEMAIFELAREQTFAGATVLIATHHLNLASRYADSLILMHEGRVAAAGPPATVLRQELLERVYAWPVRTTVHPGPGADAGAIQITPLARSAAPVAGRAGDCEP